MQIKTYSLVYLLSNLTAFCYSQSYLSYDSYSFNYKPVVEPCDLQVHELFDDLHVHKLLHKFSDDSSVVLSEGPSEAPSEAPSNAPTVVPSEAPTIAPSEAPSQSPSEAPSNAPSQTPTEVPSELSSKSQTSTSSRALLTTLSNEHKQLKLIDNIYNLFFK